jgi:hypothetical protein
MEESKNHFAPYQKMEITYQVIETFAGPTGDYRKELENEVEYYQLIIEQRNSNTLSDEEWKKWETISDESLQQTITSHLKRLENSPRDAVYIYTSDGVNMRKDVFRPEGNPMHHYYLFDGYNGYLITPEDGKVRTSPSFAEQWLNYQEFPRFGSGLDSSLGKTMHVQQVISNTENDNSTIFIVSNPTLDQKKYVMKITLLEENPLYWKTCEWKSGENTISRIICSDFRDHSGLLIPNVVIRQKPNNEDVMADEVHMTVIDVKINEEVEIEEGFFDLPSAENAKVARFNR